MRWKVVLVLALSLLGVVGGSFGLSQPARAVCSKLDPGEACCDMGPQTDPAHACYDADFAASQSREEWLSWLPMLVGVTLVGVLALCIRAVFRMDDRGAASVPK